MSFLFKKKNVFDFIATCAFHKLLFEYIHEWYNLFNNAGFLSNDNYKPLKHVHLSSSFNMLLIGHETTRVFYFQTLLIGRELIRLFMYECR